MTSSFDERQKAFENKFKHDEQVQFVVQTKTARLFGLWAAEKMMFEGEEAKSYAEQVVEADFEEPGYEDVLRKVKMDFGTKNITISESEMRQVWEEKNAQVKQELATDHK